MTRKALWAAVAVLMVSVAARADWVQYLGPTRDGKSPETGLDPTLGGGSPKVLWTVPLGEGFAGPVVKDGQVFVFDRKDSKDDILRCLDLGTGKEKWTFSYEAPGRLSFNGSRSTPAVDDKHVYAAGPMGEFHCISRETHKPVWTRHLLKDFGGHLPRWGVVACPLLYKDWVLVCIPGGKAGVVAFERATGKVAWQSPSLGFVVGKSGRGAGAFMGYYGSPMPATLGGVEQILAVGNDVVCGFRASDGKLLWTYKGYFCRIQILSPQQVGKDLVFISGGYGAGSAMIRVVKTGDAFAAEEVYKHDENTCGVQTHQPIVLDGHMYVLNNSNEHSDGMMCLDLAGKIKWKTKREPNFQRGCPLYADGMIYAVDGQTGILHLVRPSPDGYKELARAKLLDGKSIWAPTALSDGKLVLRDQSKMICIPVRK